VYNAQAEIRQLIIDWAVAAKTIDPEMFSRPTWRLVSEGHPITIST
jgi:2',3'-cyclic-nucleotide 2'-phosphodiesterase/3'-nucleotidase